MSYFSADGCACGPSERSVLTNRTMSHYIFADIPTAEIDHSIGWLQMQKADIEFKISELENLKKNRARVKAWRKNMNDVARQFMDPDSLHLDIDTRADIVRQRLGCGYDRAYAIAEIVTAWAKREVRKNRDALILMDYKNGVTAVKLARKHKLSRQQIYNIIKSDKALF